MKQPTITYRLYTSKDKKELIRCVEEMQDYFIEKDTEGWLRRTKDYGRRYVDEYLLKELKKLKGQIHLALDGKRVVGFIMGTVENFKGFDLLYFQPERAGWVYLIYVDPAYRDYKIGTDLMDLLDAFFEKEQCTIVRLEAQGNIDKLEEFYGRRGFKPWLINMVKRVRPRTKK